jgi:hypothetical protein
MHHSSVSRILFIWLAWVIVLFTYQAIVPARYTIQPPDWVLFWTPAATKNTQAQTPYLQEPFLNGHVAWDSEFYLSIALQGYDDPTIRVISAQPNAQPPFDRAISINYAFFPIYPHLIRTVAIPITKLGLSAIAAATLGGVLISIVGALVGMLALYDLARTELGDAGGFRAVFYLITFPTSFFLAQVYTEGLFIGLAWSCFALLQRKKLIWASVLAAIAALTRSVGVILFIPLALTWWQEIRSQNIRWQDLQHKRTAINLLTSTMGQQVIASGAIISAPVITHLLWRFSFFGGAFQLVEKYFFNCEFLSLNRAWISWQLVFGKLFGVNSQAQVYYAIEFGVILLGIIACVLTLRRYPGLALFGFAVIFISMTCGLTWSISRYLLTVPSIFIVLSRWGENEMFDRIWTLVSVLLLGFLTALFTFNFWVG